MVKPAKRSRSIRNIRRKAPGGRNVLHFTEKKPKRAHCAECGSVLPGVPRQRPVRMQNLSKSSKRPERPYAGMLCSQCMRKAIVGQARQ
jgi:large subunit ribosomal protein L34e